MTTPAPAPPLRPDGHRARILRAIEAEPLTVSDIIRRVPRMKRDPSVNRLKVRGLLLTLKRDRLAYRSSRGWAATNDGLRVLSEITGAGW